MSFWVEIGLFLLPIYVANASAMVFGGGTPMDLGGRAWDGRPWLGKGKTFKGTFFGVFFGAMTALVLAAMFPVQTAAMVPNFVLFGFVISCGALMGDIVESFLKRRLGFSSGHEWVIADQMDFIVGALVFGWMLFLPTLAQIIAIVVISLVMHRLANLIAFKTKLKTVPW
ncbi:MAG: CDP-2,3-bis-(O-geranylgeranyl)-sn-glycerol synthase [Candidatus Diapherotrites archaeon]|nr:CDP-2,3-bis-(O-geranylgeranyl)-sn-glycerol synthase [Candidatus Diapherotrites archaeon]